MLKSIFSIIKSKNHVIYKFLGLKLKLKHTFDKKKYNLFINHSVKLNTILIVEINDCHWETILGYCKYLIDLGFNVEIITRYYAEEIFASLNINDKIKVFEFNRITFDKIFKNYNFANYERIMYNSKRLYWKENDVNNEGLDLFECYNKIPKGKKDNIYIQHHIDKINDFYKPNQIILANPSKNQELEDLVVNPHYFGEFKFKNYKNPNIVNFISIGELSEKRRNANLLISSVKELHNSGLRNFKITIIGKGKIDEIDAEIQKYFSILGRVDYQIMFEYLNKADFVLPLLDPGIESHKRYMDSGTSGTFQLVYGFNKPCIIHKTFADIYGFNTTNSIVYEDNSEISQSMVNAINLTNEDYNIIQNNLRKTVEDIEKQSIKNLKTLLSKGV